MFFLRVSPSGYSRGISPAFSKSSRLSSQWTRVGIITQSCLEDCKAGQFGEFSGLQIISWTHQAVNQFAGSSFTSCPPGGPRRRGAAGRTGLLLESAVSSRTTGNAEPLKYQPAGGAVIYEQWSDFMLMIRLMKAAFVCSRHT